MSQKGFANIILVIVIIIFVGVVGYFAFVKKSEPIVQQPTPTLDKTANWETYTNSQYGFSFKYPPTWAVIETRDAILVAPRQDEANGITFQYVPSAQKEKSLNVLCPLPSGDQAINSIVDTIHNVECKNLESANGVRYARGINTGQFQFDKRKQLNGWFLNSKVQVYVSVPFTDISGEELPTSSEIISAFDGIMQSIKFITQITQTKTPVPTPTPKD